MLYRPTWRNHILTYKLKINKNAKEEKEKEKGRKERKLLVDRATRSKFSSTS